MRDLAGKKRKVSSQRTIQVAGICLHGDGYSNAAQTIRLLRASGEWDVRDLAHWLPPQTRLWHLATGPWRRRIVLAGWLVIGGFAQAARLLLRHRYGKDLVYLPYPAPLTLWWLSFIPRRWRPLCVADAFISLWDSTFRDRSRAKGTGFLSQRALRYERRSLGAAVMVLVDTERNRQEFIQKFCLEPGRVRSLPLAIDEARFQAADDSDSAERERIRVLFVGTLVPLHGIEALLGAIELLADRTDLEFRLVGDGQDSDIVEAFVRRVAPKNFSWVREWQSLDAVASEVRRADVCLGVFGGSGKASRVLPFKLYYALAAGKPIITQSAYSLPEGAPVLPAVLVSGETHTELVANLAGSISTLASDPARRVDLSRAAAAYFAQYLSGAIVLEEWRQLSRANALGASFPRSRK